MRTRRGWDMTAKPLKSGRRYVDSGFVHDMMDTKTEEHYSLKAHVWPSMRNELPPQCFDNLISVEWCSHSRIMRPCKVSALGRCSHVVAVFFSLLAMSMNKGLPTISTPAPAKNVHGIKGKRETKILKDSRRSSILQKGSSAVPMILTQGLNRSGELPPVT